MLMELIQAQFPTRQEPLPLAAISEQMTKEISEFLQKVDLIPAKHKMLKEFLFKIVNCIPN